MGKESVFVCFEILLSTLRSKLASKSLQVLRRNELPEPCFLTLNQANIAIKNAES